MTLLMTQAHIIFSGTVQGVGFRYATKQMASELGLTGWVRNLKSGNVEILAEGRQEDIEHLTAELNRHFNGYIQDSKITYQTAEGSFLDFRIIF